MWWDFAQYAGRQGSENAGLSVIQLIHVAGLDISTVQRDQQVNMEENLVRFKKRLRLSERTLPEEH